MPRAYDRRLPTADKDPTKDINAGLNLAQYRLDAASAILAVWTAFGQQLQAGLLGTLSTLFNVENFVSFVQGAVATIQAIIDGIVAGFQGLPSPGEVVDGVVDAIAGLLGIGNHAQDTADVANSEIAKLNARLGITGVEGGVYIIDGFDGGAHPLDDNGYTTVESGFGASKMGTDGAGCATLTGYFLDTMGRTSLAFSDTELGTDNNAVTVVLKDDITVSNLSPIVWIIARANATFDTFVYAQLKDSKVRLGCFVAGSESVFVDHVAANPNGGDMWTLKAGTDAEPYRFRLYANGSDTPVIDFTDEAHISHVGSGYRTPGLGETTGSNLLLFLVAPPRITTFTASDYAA